MKSTNIIFSNYRLCSVRFLGNSYVHLKGWCTGGRLGYRGYYSALFLNGFVISRTALGVVRLNLFNQNLLLHFSTSSSPPKGGSNNNIIPAVVYTNADTEKIDILKYNKDRSGIYR